jgi:hypothetical protein
MRKKCIFFQILRLKIKRTKSEPIRSPAEMTAGIFFPITAHAVQDRRKKDSLTNVSQHGLSRRSK